MPAAVMIFGESCSGMAAEAIETAQLALEGRRTRCSGMAAEAIETISNSTPVTMSRTLLQRHALASAAQ